jgi:hypothetical protein
MYLSLLLSWARILNKSSEDYNGFYNNKHNLFKLVNKKKKKIAGTAKS